MFHIRFFLINLFIINCLSSIRSYSKSSEGGGSAWCDPTLCPNHRQHIACENNGSFHRRCEIDAVDIDITNYKDTFLKAHNERRNLIALGFVKGYYQADRMATMVWDDELQYLAMLNLHTCILDHDACHNTYRFMNAGQNLCAVSRQRSAFVNVTSLIDEVVSLWFDEYLLVDSTYIDKLRVTDNFMNYGHFLGMIVDRNAHVGCAIIRLTRVDFPSLYIYRIACNYGSTYALDAPIYKRGSPGSKCLWGRNPLYLGLCSTEEIIDPNY